MVSVLSEAGIAPGECENFGICNRIAITSRYGPVSMWLSAVFVPRKRVVHGDVLGVAGEE